METEVEQRRRMSLELDAREQMAFTASFLKDYSEPLLVVSESRLRNNARRF